MRLNEFLSKEEDKIIHNIKKNCSQIVKLYKDNKRKLSTGPKTPVYIKSWHFLHPQLVFYRGYKSSSSFLIKTPRTNRTPRDTPDYVHDMFDEAFKNKFGWKARSEGVFVTSKLVDTLAYGKPFIFYPFDGFKFIWSSDIRDLTFNFNYSLDNPDYLDEFVNDAVYSYTDKNLRSALISANEVMFKCKRYYLLSSLLNNSIFEKILE